MKPLRCVSEGLVQRKTGAIVITYPQSEGQETQCVGGLLSDLAYLDKGAFIEAGRLRIDLSPELRHPLSTGHSGTLCERLPRSLSSTISHQFWHARSWAMLYAALWLTGRARPRAAQGHCHQRLASSDLLGITRGTCSNNFSLRKMPYFLDYKTHFPPQIWEENGGASSSLNVAYTYIGEILCYFCY